MPQVYRNLFLLGKARHAPLSAERGKGRRFWHSSCKEKPCICWLVHPANVRAALAIGAWGTIVTRGGLGEALQPERVIVFDLLPERSPVVLDTRKGRLLLESREGVPYPASPWIKSL